MPTLCTMLPSADEILERAHVVALPMAVKFRGVTTREALLIDGPAGWGEFSPFTEYGPQESAAWLASGIEAAFTGLPEAHGEVEVNGTIPAVEAAEKLGELEYIEQPCATVEELAEVRRRTSTPIAADESIRRAADPYRVAELGAADVAVCKVAPLGGVDKLLRIARDLNLDVTVASALDTAVGMDAGLVAAKLTGSRAAGLATQRLFVEDVAAPRELANGRLEITRTTPDPDRLHGLRAPAKRRDWWFDRVRACVEVLSVDPQFRV